MAVVVVAAAVTSGSEASAPAAAVALVVLKQAASRKVLQRQRLQLQRRDEPRRRVLPTLSSCSMRDEVRLREQRVVRPTQRLPPWMTQQNSWWQRAIATCVLPLLLLMLSAARATAAQRQRRTEPCRALRPLH
jgi:hypothetical protein